MRQQAALGEQGHGQLREFGQVGHGAGDDGRPAAAVAALGGDVLGPRGRHLHAIGQPKSRHCDIEETGLLADRLDQQRPARRQR